MKTGLLAVLGSCYLTAATAQVAPPTAERTPWQQACLDLSTVELPELAALEAQWNPAGLAALGGGANAAADARDLPATCRVRGRVEPAIGFEVWLPAGDSWNGRFLGAGNDDALGGINYAGMLEFLRQGYATASTDMGHAADNFAWLGDPGRLRDFGYRAIYEMTSKARALTDRYYGRPADYRYFNGCSVGGRQGLMEAERFPGDYDGIVAGSPLNPLIDAAATQIWLSVAPTATGGSARLDRSALAVASDAAVEQCDALDGVRDGVLEDPRRCNFAPARLQCGLTSARSCLSAPALAALEQTYAGPRAADGSVNLPGLAFGSESGWSFVSGDGPPALAVELMRRAVLADLNWDWRRFDLATDHAAAVARAGWMLDATRADLSEFRDSGSKLLIYQGWNDAVVSPEAAIAYYETVEAKLTGQPNPLALAASDFARLFMVPGMAHCGGGSGTDQFDAQRAIEDWVERGIAPARIEASRLDAGAVSRTRPLCPYPQIARYRGNGNSDRSGSFVCDY